MDKDILFQSYQILVYRRTVLHQLTMYPREDTLRLACVRNRLSHYCSVTVLQIWYNYTNTTQNIYIYTVTLQQTLSKINVLWNMTLCWLVIRYRCFEETWWNHVQRDPRLIIHSSWINQHSAIPQHDCDLQQCRENFRHESLSSSNCTHNRRCCPLNYNLLYLEKQSYKTVLFQEGMLQWR
jgi:hypothetical protein